MKANSLSLFALTVLTTAAFAQDTATKPPVDPSGTWKWEREFNGNKIDYTLQLKQKDKTLSGTYKTIFANGGPGPSDPVNIENVKFDGETFSFSVKRRFNDNEFTVSYQGKLAGDKITGNAEIDFGNGVREFEWNAQRVVTVDDLVGKWNLKFETPNGVVEPSLTLAKKDNQLVGTYHSTMFGDNPIKEVALKDNQLSFVVVLSNDNREFRVQYKAAPKGDNMQGTIAANFEGQEWETSFQGARASASKSDDQDDDEDEDEDDDDQDDEDAK